MTALQNMSCEQKSIMCERQEVIGAYDCYALKAVQQGN